ncbi:MAG TPA: FaeA/PapI family transcriptional regulator [Streptosporangiaceae bacterium]|jgi:hypothetical protein
MATADESLARLLRELLDKVNVDLEDARAIMRAAQGRIQELETEQAGLTLSLKRYGGHAATASHASGTVGAAGIPEGAGDAERPTGYHPELAAQDAQISYADRAYEGLKALRRPATTQEVAEKAGITGEQARNALTYLKNKKNLVKRQPSGLWEVATDSDSPSADANKASGGPPVIAGVAVPAGGIPGAN